MMRPWSVTAWLKAEALRKVACALVQHIVVTPLLQRGTASCTLTRRMSTAPMNPKYIEPMM